MSDQIDPAFKAAYRETQGQPVDAVGRPSVPDRIKDYLANGGLFNPEMMPQGPVRDLLIDCRSALSEQAARIADLMAENKNLGDEIDNLEAEGCDYDDTIRNLEAQLNASRAECEGLRATIRKALKEIRKGRPDPDKIYDILRAALSQKGRAV